MKKLQETQLHVTGNILGEIEAAMDHVTAAFDMAHENNVPMESNLLDIKTQLWLMQKSFAASYKTLQDACIKRDAKR